MTRTTSRQEVAVEKIGSFEEHTQGHPVLAWGRSVATKSEFEEDGASQRNVTRAWKKGQSKRSPRWQS